MSIDVMNDSVRELAKDAVGRVSPAELPQFEMTARRYFRDPKGVLAARPARDEQLGFGAEAIVVLLGPFALELTKRVLTRLVEKTGDAAADGLATRVLAWLGGGRAASSTESTNRLSLDPRELAVVRDVTRTEAQRLELTAPDAARLADAVVAALATRV